MIKISAQTSLSHHSRIPVTAHKVSNTHTHTQRHIRITLIRITNIWTTTFRDRRIHASTTRLSNSNKKLPDSDRIKVRTYKHINVEKVKVANLPAQTIQIGIHSSKNPPLRNNIDITYQI